MSLKDELTNATKEAMKTKDSATLSTLRMLRSAIKNKEIDVQHELSDEEVLNVVKAQVKQLKDSLVSFEQAGRQDLAEPVKKEIKVLEVYLPAEMSDDELKVIVQKTINETGAESKADMGKVMGAAMKSVQGKADGNRVKNMVEQLLSVFALVVFGVAAAEPVFAQIPLTTEPTQVFPLLDSGLRIFRILLLWGGIFAIVSILRGSFEYSFACYRNDSRTNALSKMTTGIIGVIIVVGLFSVTSVFLQKM